MLRRIGDATGMFPIDIATGSNDARMLAQVDQLVETPDWILAGRAAAHDSAGGEQGGQLSATGAKLLDPTGPAASRRDRHEPYGRRLRV